MFISESASGVLRGLIGCAEKRRIKKGDEANDKDSECYSTSPELQGCGRE